MPFSVSIPDALHDFLLEEMEEAGHDSLDACVAAVLQRSLRRRGPRLTLEVEGQTYRLTRLDDPESDACLRRSIAIREQFDYYLSRAKDFDLAQVYAVCRHLFGERGQGFDDWKGGFAFPLALDVPRAARRPAYTLSVVNYRGGVELNLRQLVAPDDPRLANPVYYRPEAAEFSADEIQVFMNFFSGFLQGYFETLEARWTERFSLAVPSNLILYGFNGEQFFRRQFKFHRAFDKIRNAAAACLPEPGFYPCHEGFNDLEMGG